MISGAHAIIFSSAAEELRTLLRDVLELPSVDAGAGWLIFALPPSELAVHPGESARHELYLLTDDLDTTLERLRSKGVEPAEPISEQAWGRVTAIPLPDGTKLALYQPRHPRPTT